MVQPPSAKELPARERHRIPGWVVAVRSEVGLVRARLEDAWCVAQGLRLGGRPHHALAVFDGLGGLPNGQEAAWAAADKLPEAVTTAPRAEEVLARLNNWVRETQGATTAVVALIPAGTATGHGLLLSVGDSAAYLLEDDQGPVLLTPKDSEGGNVVTDFLGSPDLRGHTTEVEVPRGAALLLCTDGVDGVVPAASLTRVLKAPDLAAALDDLFAEILANGAPDNATVVVARRTT